MSSGMSDSNASGCLTFLSLCSDLDLILVSLNQGLSRTPKCVELRLQHHEP